MSDSFFRDMLEHLRHQPALPKRKHLATPTENSQDDQGVRAEWSQLLRFVIEAELARIRKEGQPYQEKVFIDRDKHSIKNEFVEGQHREALLQQQLYREVHRHGNGCLQLGEESVLLISYNVPNQGRHRRRCADLVGLRLNGSLVVFECKVKGNKDNPFRAVLEGLDYLGHLAIPANIASLQKDFGVWHGKERDADARSKIPPDFHDVTVRPEARHSVIVLAPEGYFSDHQRGNRHHDWHLLSDRAWTETTLSVGLDFGYYRFYVCSLSPLKALTHTFGHTECLTVRRLRPLNRLRLRFAYRLFYRKLKRLLDDRSKRLANLHLLPLFGYLSQQPMSHERISSSPTRLG